MKEVKKLALIAVCTCIVNATCIGIITDTLVSKAPQMIEEIKVADMRSSFGGLEVLTTETTTTTTETPTSTTTETTTTTITIEETTEEYVEYVQELAYDYYDETTAVDYCYDYTYGITDVEKVMLANVVGGEYGADWVSLYDKALVVATVMNRYYDGGWQGYNYDGSLRENTIYNIITAQGQYDTFYANAYYNWNVTQSCIDAVDYYFSNQYMFPHVTSFYGDGTYNYFS